MFGIHAGCTAKLRRSNDERVVEHPTALEVAQQAGDGLVDDLRVLRVLGHVGVLVPVVAGATVHPFDEAHATMLHLLGLDHDKLTYRYRGRDWTLTDLKGNVVKEILT